MQYAFGDLLADITRPFIIGVFIAGAITCLLPADLGVWAGKNPFLSMILMLTAGIPMYVCATSSTPIAAALILKGLNPGAALVFLLAGPATNAATMTIIKTLFNTRALVIYLGTITVCSLAMGFMLDRLYVLAGISAGAVVGQATDILPAPVQWLSAMILTLLIFRNYLAAIRR